MKSAAFPTGISTEILEGRIPQSSAFFQEGEEEVDERTKRKEKLRVERVIPVRRGRQKIFSNTAGVPN